MSSILLCLGLLKLSALAIIGVEGQSAAGISPSFDRQYPFVVSIQYNNPNASMGSHCMGVILTKKWVGSSCFCLNEITARDPLQLSSPFRFRLIAGTKVNIPKPGIVRFPSQIFNHPKCDWTSKLYDFALMPVTYDFPTADFDSGRISTMPLNSQNVQVISENFNKILQLKPICRTVGWVDSGIDQNENLYIFEVELVPESVCSQVICIMVPSICIAGEKAPKAEDMGMVCGRALNGTPCAGMGGAPLICGSNVWATASLLNKCGEKLVNHNYVVFTRITIALKLVSLLLGNITISTSGHPASYRPTPTIFGLFLFINFMVFWKI